MEKKIEIVKQKLGQVSCSRMRCADCWSKGTVYMCGYAIHHSRVKFEDMKRLFTESYDEIKDVDLEKVVDTYVY